MVLLALMLVNVIEAAQEESNLVQLWYSQRLGLRNELVGSGKAWLSGRAHLAANLLPSRCEIDW
jgi:hypothetical protein